MGKGTGINKATDNSFKVIFGEPLLFVQFIRDFINIDLLKDIEASDNEDVATACCARAFVIYFRRTER
ncbi:MAG: hypothetical protein LBN12_07510 [Clostridiales Family XIII bacterium]|nr:hypothetical protein [Clostridiales Family XIII bacterium]